MAVKIGSRLVGPGQPCFIVAEIGINHNGSIEIAKQLIDAAVDAGCDAVKFQKRDVETVYSTQDLATPRVVDPSIIRNAIERSKVEGIRRRVLPDASLARFVVDPADTTNGDLKYALEFNLKDFDTIERYCHERGIMWFASTWDGMSAHFMNGFDVPCHKIASACLTHKDLLIRVRSNRKPVILSTGGSTMDQVRRAVQVLGTDDLIILHCVANYPCTNEEINLRVIQTLRAEFPGVPVGYSGHEADILPSVIAVSMGACVVERHVTLDKGMPGSDQKASLTPDQFSQLVSAIRSVEKSSVELNELAPKEQLEIILGDGIKKVLPSEVAVMKKLRRKDTLFTE